MKRGQKMQKILNNCQMNQKEDVMRILKTNQYKAVEFLNEKEVILLLEVYDYQINLLIKIMRDYSKDVTVHVCQQISYF